jgi:hypothetical protein
MCLDARVVVRARSLCAQLLSAVGSGLGDSDRSVAMREGRYCRSSTRRPVGALFQGISASVT